jgi:phytoene dehydrogenase-like protein
VIGGGIGGLTAAALMARAGARVAVCEQHSQLGGYCHAWRRRARIDGRRLDLRFDAAVHDISGAGLGGPVRTVLGWLGLADSLEWGHVGQEYCFPTGLYPGADPDAWLAALKERFPADAEGLDRLFGILRESYRELYGNVAITGGLPRGPRSYEERVRFREACPVLTRCATAPFCELRDECVRDGELREIVSACSAYVTSDVRRLSFANILPLFGYLFAGGHYPRGGSQALADALAGAVSAAGGWLATRTPVRRIAVRNGRAAGLILHDGSRLEADVVISNADAAQTFGRLIDGCELPVALAHSASRIEQSDSAVMVYLAVRAEEPPPAVTTIMMDGREGVMISRPPFPECRAPAGYATVTLTRLAPAGTGREWNRSDPGYRARKRGAGDRLIDLAEKRLPGLRRQIVYREDATPATLERFTWATGGGGFGSTPATRWRSHETPIGGLYLVGASMGLGPGIEAVMVAGASLAQQLGAGTDAPAAAMGLRDEHSLEWTVASG